MPYHLTEAGEPAPCRAVKRACPRGGAEAHYKTLAEARLAYEAGKDSFGLRPEALAESLRSRFPGLEVRLRPSHGGFVVLEEIRLPRESQGAGTGSKVMALLAEEADRQGWKLALTPSTAWGASSKGRLEKFYRRFGFLPNRGRHKDYTTMEAMVRRPATKLPD